MNKKCATSNIYDTIHGGEKVMKGGAPLSNISDLIYKKKEFLVKIFANLITQLGITYYVMTNYDYEEDELGVVKGKRIWIVVLSTLFVIFVIAMVPMDIYSKLALFTIFSLLNGLLLSRLMQVTDPRIVKVAILGTLGIFAAFFLLGAFLLSSGIALGLRTGMVLLGALLFLIIALIISIFMGPEPAIVRYLTGFGLILFSIYIVYDTNRILQKDYFGDFVTASLDYYLDIINIFIRLLSYGRSGEY